MFCFLFERCIVCNRRPRHAIPLVDIKAGFVTSNKGVSVLRAMSIVALLLQWWLGGMSGR